MRILLAKGINGIYDNSEGRRRRKTRMAAFTQQRRNQNETDAL